MLDLIEEDQSAAIDPADRRKSDRQSSQDSIRAKITFEYGNELRPFKEIQSKYTLVMLSCELHHSSRLANLPLPMKNQRKFVTSLFPMHKILDDFPFQHE